MRASPDGIIILSHNGKPMLGILEIKTATVLNTEVGQCLEMLETGGDAFAVVQNGRQFRREISNVSHRIQVLHTSVTVGADVAVFVKATRTSIIRVVIILISHIVHDQYKEFVSYFQITLVPWTLAFDPETSAKAVANKLFHIVKEVPSLLQRIPDETSLAEGLRTAHAVREFRMKLGKPLPAAKYIVPYLIGLWNTVKGGLDDYSQAVSNVR